MLNAEEHASIDCSSPPPNCCTAHQGYSTLSVKQDTLSRMQILPGFTIAFQSQYHTSSYMTLLRGSLWVEEGKSDLWGGEFEDGRRFINPKPLIKQRDANPQVLAQIIAIAQLPNTHFIVRERLMLISSHRFKVLSKELVQASASYASCSLSP